MLHKMRGEAKAKVADIDGAIEDFTKAIKLLPNDPDAYAGRSDARRFKGDSKGADEDLADAGRFKAASGHQ